MRWTAPNPLPSPHVLPVRGSPTRSLAELIARQAQAAHGPGPALPAAVQYVGTLIEGHRILSRRVMRRETAGAVSVELALAEGLHRLRYDATGAWAQAPGQAAPARLAGEAARALWRATQWPGPTRTLAEVQARGHSLALLGMADQPGSPHYVLRLRLTDGAVRDYALDARTHRLGRARDVLAAPGAEPLELAWEDYRLVAGRQVAFGEEERSLTGGGVRRIWQWRAVSFEPPGRARPA